MANIDNSSEVGGRRRPMPLLRWMQVVGVLYLVQFVMMVFVRAPIRTFGPDGALAKANAGDPLAEFLVDTWTTFGLEVGAVGVVLLTSTRRPDLAKGAIWTVLAIELGRGIVLDGYMVARGNHVAGYLVWIVIHTAVIATGLLALRTDRTSDDVPVASSVAAGAGSPSKRA